MKTLEDWIADDLVRQEDLEAAAATITADLNSPYGPLNATEQIAEYLVPRVAIHVLEYVARAYREAGLEQERTFGVSNPGNEHVARQLFEAALAISMEMP